MYVHWWLAHVVQWKSTQHCKAGVPKGKSKNESPTERTHTHLHAHRHQTGHRDKVHVTYRCLPEHRRMMTASRSPAVLRAQRAVPIRVRRCMGAGAGGGPGW